MLRQICVGLSLCLGCANGAVAPNPPVDRPYYPSALLERDGHLFVLSSNADQKYRYGNLLVLDQSQIEAELSDLIKQHPTDPLARVVDGRSALRASFFVPSLANHMAFAETQETTYLLIASGGTKELVFLKQQDAAWNCLKGSVFKQQFGQQCSLTDTLSTVGFQPDKLTFPAGLEQPNGLMGASLDPIRIPNEKQEIAELRVLAWEPSSKQFQVAKGLSLIQLWKSFQSSLNTKKGFRESSEQSERAHLGHVQWFAHESNHPLAGMVLVAFDHLSFSIDGLEIGRTAKLLWFPASALFNEQVNPSEIGFFDLSAVTQGRVTGAWTSKLDPKNGTLHLYGILKEPAGVFRVDFKKDKNSQKVVAQLVASQAVCEAPQDIQVVPDQSQVVVSCFSPDPGSIGVLDADTLKGVAWNATFGRGPFQLLVSKTHPGRLYVSYFLDGSIGIFELSRAPSFHFVPLGRLFAPSLRLQPGGS